MRESTRAEKRAALLAATFAAFLTPFLGAALNVALPSIAAEFNADAILLNLTATVYLSYPLPCFYFHLVDWVT